MLRVHVHTCVHACVTEGQLCLLFLKCCPLLKKKTLDVCACVYTQANACHGARMEIRWKYQLLAFLFHLVWKKIFLLMCRWGKLVSVSFLRFYFLWRFELKSLGLHVKHFIHWVVPLGSLHGFSSSGLLLILWYYFPPFFAASFALYSRHPSYFRGASVPCFLGLQPAFLGCLCDFVSFFIILSRCSLLREVLPLPL